MSNAAMSCAWDAPDSPANPGAKFVLIVLADHASDHSGEDWAAFPSVDRLVKRTGYGRGAVERHLKALVETGWISRARRVRPDGKLGIYDYTVHRDPAVRAGLRAARSGAFGEGAGEGAGEGSGEGLSEGSDGAEPCAILEHGPCSILEPAMLHFEAEPCSKMEHQEPLVEPLVEPSTASAREPGDEGFDEAIAVWPESGRKRTRWGKARAAFAFACQQVDPSALNAAVRACAADPQMAKGDWGWPGFDTWLAEESWRAWIGVRPTTAGGLGGSSGRTPFAGPPALRAAIVAALGAEGEGFAAAYLDRCRLTEGGALAPATRFAFDKLTEWVGGIITSHGVALAAPSSGGKS